MIVRGGGGGNCRKGESALVVQFTRMTKVTVKHISGLTIKIMGVI